ncbi:DEKNAAC100216 [Brettanomyces naardenensis]|uniref:DEKNAAC100216 n=1 Tax=Brettanomyces naardenensis TaxID=13370 RepID=A0A448YGB2_BRENA|nr:DEKNAAC100216 [Brettanomyces naardenensis]
MDIHRCRFVDYTPESVTSLAFSHRSNSDEPTPRSLRLAVGRADGSIEIWNPRNSQSDWLLESSVTGGSGRSVEGLVWATKDSSSRLFSIGGSTFLSEWDLNRGVPLKNQDCNAGVIWSCAINNSQDKIAVGCDNGTVVVVDISGGPGVIEHEAVLQKQQSRVLCLCWINNDMIIGGCADGRIRCWSYSGDNKGRLLQTLRVDKSKVESTLVWSVIALPGGKQFVSGDSTGSVKIWDLKHLALQQSFTVHEADVLCLTADPKGTHFFSAGVDRKIFNFSLTKLGKNASKWVNSTNRLLHGNDIRTMASFQSKNADLLVSGGVERIVLVNSMENFQSSIAIKLPIHRISSNVIVNQEKRLIIMWQHQQVKIWMLGAEDHTKKLMAKLSLSDPEDISSVAVSKNGRYLAVARISTIRLFELILLENKLQVIKVASSLLNSMGARLIRFAEEEKLLLMCDIDNEISSVQFNADDDEDDEENISEFDDEQKPEAYDMPESLVSDYSHNYTQFVVSHSGSLVALSNFDGCIDILNLDTKESKRLLRMNDSPTALNFTPRDTLLVATVSHKVLEFDVKGLKGVNIYTEWSRKNSELLPAQFIKLAGQPFGIFENNNRFWVYGSDWLCSFDALKNISSTKHGKKRSANGTITGDNTISDFNDKTFWRTFNYKSLLLVDRLSDHELVVVERPVEEMPSVPAFRLSKISL